MAELNDILASGSVPEYKRGAAVVIDTESLAAALQVEYLDGLNIPVLADDGAAANNTMYWNVADGRLRYKSIGGIVLQFNMSLVP
jgi:hypothetical protein